MKLMLDTSAYVGFKLQKLKAQWKLFRSDWML